MPPSIRFFKEDVAFRLLNQNGLRDWIIAAIRKESGKAGQMNFIFCSDPYLRRMNKKHLQHDYNTDIITFDTRMDPAVVEGDIFISVDRVKVNAKDYEASFTDELHRVIIHGVLHLCGYSDKSPAKQKTMRAKEDEWLKRRKWTIAARKK